MYFPRDEYEQRWERVYDAMADQGFEWALIWGRSGGTYERYSDVLYLANYYSSQSGQQYDGPGWMGIAFSALILGGREAPQLVADEPDYPQELLPFPLDRYAWEKNTISGAARALRDRGATGRVAFVGSDFLPVKYYDVLRAELPDGIELVPADDLVRTLRLRKSPRELDCYREVGAKVTRALDALMEVAIKPGATQADAAAAGTAELMRGGGIPHMVPVSSGPTLFRHCGDPLLGFSHDVTLEAGDMVRVWLYGPAWQGYWSDPGRTAVVGGRPNERQRELIRSANDIVIRLMGEVRPGRRLVEVIEIGNRLRAEANMAEDQPGKMWPIYGHGVGLFWEDPWLLHDLDDDTLVFHEGQTFSTEVFLHWPDVGSAGVEQNFIVHEGGNELLTTSRLEWF
jgi:Xaa-Pro aminopeptidase